MEAVAASLKLDYYYYKNDLDSILIEVENVKKISKQNGQLKYFYFAWGSRLIIYYIKQHQTSTAIYEAQKCSGRPKLIISSPESYSVIGHWEPFI